MSFSNAVVKLSDDMYVSAPKIFTDQTVRVPGFYGGNRILLIISW